MNQRQMRSVRLDGTDIEQKRQELRSYFHQSFDLFESLFDLLKSDEVYYRQSEPTRHPMIFYFGHTAAFYINKLVLCGALSKRLNPHFESLFSVGVDEMVWDEESGRFEWPDVMSVREYRHQVRECVDTLIGTMQMSLPITQSDPFWAIWMGIEHERIHIETSSVLHRQMPIEFIRSQEIFPLCPILGDIPENCLISFPGGEVILGKGKEDHGYYGWDNEYGIARYEVNDFEASKFLVSNGEFLDFVANNGYGISRWWSEEGLKYLSIRNAVCPPFWIPQEDGSYAYRTLTQIIPLPMNWPVEVNVLEAEAFCRWKSAQDGENYRLPSEAEWTLMIRSSGIDEEVFDDQRSNLNLAHFASSVPVDTFAHGDIYDAVGNVWQWTQTPIDGFEGFAPHPWYDDFSTPTFDTKHNLLKGGSWISTGNEIVASSRYAFRRHFIQHAGFRYVVGEEHEARLGRNVIQEEDVIGSCRFFYETGLERIVECAQKLSAIVPTAFNIMELGCGAGRFSFELSRYFDSVVGIDFSARFIGVGVKLLSEEQIEYQEENGTKKIVLSDVFPSKKPNNVAFYQGDIYNLKPNLKGYGCILIDDFQESIEWGRLNITDLCLRLEEEGYLVIVTSMTRDVSRIMEDLEIITQRALLSFPQQQMIIGKKRRA